VGSFVTVPALLPLPPRTMKLMIVSLFCAVAAAPVAVAVLRVKDESDPVPVAGASFALEARRPL
jgi:hypothetical protein